MSQFYIPRMKNIFFYFTPLLQKKKGQNKGRVKINKK